MGKNFIDSISAIFKARSTGLFFILLLFVFYSLDYHHILFLHPQGIHFIRQTDSLSFVKFYLNHGMKFFDTGVYNLSSEGGRAACEFPVLYYLTAWLYKMTGEHEYILRLMNIIIVSYGFFCLFRLLVLQLHDIFYSFVFTFLFLSSTILLYYTNNYLPDAAALGFSLAGWYYAYLYFLSHDKTSSLVAGFVLFALSSLIKITYFINPAAFIITVLFSDLLKRNHLDWVLKANLGLIVSFATVLFLVLAWNLYILHYNNLNHDSYFLVHPLAIWNLDKKGMASVWDYIFNYWYSRYYYQSTIHFIAILVITGLLLIRHSVREMLLLSTITLSGSIIYFLLFFEQFRNHDYYFLALLPGIIFTSVSSFLSLVKRFPKFTNNLLTRSVLLLLCILSLNYARQKLAERYDTKNDLFSVIGNKLDGTREFLAEKGIPESEKVILVTDLTPNGGLYFLDRSGWNLKDTSALSMQYLRNHIAEGAGIIILTDSNYLKNKGLEKWLGDKVGDKNNILIYKAKSSD